MEMDWDEQTELPSGKLPGIDGKRERERERERMIERLGCCVTVAATGRFVT